jgi:hypothetical protein
MRPVTVLEQPTPEMQTLRAVLTHDGHWPTRRTWERRLKAFPSTLPAQIGCLGRHLVALLNPWATGGRAVAVDSTVPRACGASGIRRTEKRGKCPVSSMDTEAHCTKSGWHGWVYGWKLHIACVVAAVWIPVVASLTAANPADNEVAPALIGELPTGARFVLGDIHYNAPDVQAACEQTQRILVVPSRAGSSTAWTSEWGSNRFSKRPDDLRPGLTWSDRIVHWGGNPARVSRSHSAASLVCEVSYWTVTLVFSTLTSTCCTPSRPPRERLIA